MSDKKVPLCLDIFGTVITCNTAHESALALVRRSPWALFSLCRWALRGDAVLLREAAARIEVDANTLALRHDLLEWLHAERAGGRPLILVTAAGQEIALQLARQLALFDDAVLSHNGEGGRRGNKEEVLVDRYGERGFDYVGTGRDDTGAWRASRKAIVVGTPATVAEARKVVDVDRVFPIASVGIATWLSAIRIHQWAKNLIVFLPALLAHKLLQSTTLVSSLLAFVAFGLCASSVYLVNDLLDLASDRRHPRKRHRPFAAGILSVRAGLLASAALLIISALIAAFINWKFCLVLGAYYFVTWSYSLRLKRIALLDVMTLAGLYTIRIIAGAAATAIPLSFWLLAFSVFIFLSLAIVKRYTELYEASHAGTSRDTGRGYSAADLPLLLSLGTAAGYCTVVVMALYINSTDSQVLYVHHKPLWLICPLLLFWISRIWLLTTRGLMHDDPVVFALRDRISLLVLGLLGASVVVAT